MKSIRIRRTKISSNVARVFGPALPTFYELFSGCQRFSMGLFCGKSDFKGSSIRKLSGVRWNSRFVFEHTRIDQRIAKYDAGPLTTKSVYHSTSLTFVVSSQLICRDHRPRYYLYYRRYYVHYPFTLCERFYRRNVPEIVIFVALSVASTRRN